MWKINSLSRIWIGFINICIFMFVYNWTDLSRRGLSATVRLSTQTFGLLSHSGRKDYKEDCGFLCSVFNEICSSMESI